jgi:hypothetical protein
MCECLVIQKVLPGGMIPKRRLELLFMVGVLVLSHGLIGSLFFWSFSSSGIFTMPLEEFASAVYSWILGDLGGILSFYPVFYFWIFPDLINGGNGPIIKGAIDAMKKPAFWMRHIIKLAVTSLFVYLAIGTVPVVDRTEGRQSNRLFILSVPVVGTVFEYGRKGAAFSIIVFNVGILGLILIFDIQDFGNFILYLNV